MNLTIGFLGLGLIGGSIAKSIRKYHPDYTLIGYNHNYETTVLAKKEQILDYAAKEVDASFQNCDIIYLCMPVSLNEDYLIKIKPYLKLGCILTDVGSVKGTIHRAVKNLSLEAYFIGGHPMAGSEKSGYQYADASILKGATYVITPFDTTDQNKLAAYKTLVEQMQSNVIVMDYKQHDYCVASVSHLPHLISAALSKLVCENDDADKHMHMLAAGGFKDTTRIAASSPEMWEQICASNGTAISTLLKKYIHLLQEIEEHINTDNSNNNEYIRQLFQIARDYRNTF